MQAVPPRGPAPERERRSAVGLEEARLLALPVALLLGLALVGHLLAARDAEEELGHAALVEIELEGHEGHALPADALVEPGELGAVDEELAPAAFVMAEGRRLGIGGNVAVDEPELPALDRCIALGDLGLAVPEGFHLRSLEHDPGLDLVLDEIVVPGAAVLRDELHLRLILPGHCPHLGKQAALVHAP